MAAFSSLAFDTKAFSVNAFSFDTVQTGISGAGGANIPLKWYDDQELRPNWYLYPEERKKLKTELKRVVAQKKLYERVLKTPSANVETAVLRITELQVQLNHLTAVYFQMVSLMRAKKIEEEESMLVMLLAEM